MARMTTAESVRIARELTNDVPANIRAGRSLSLLRIRSKYRADGIKSYIMLKLLLTEAVRVICSPHRSLLFSEKSITK